MIVCPPSTKIKKITIVFRSARYKLILVYLFKLSEKSLKRILKEREICLMKKSTLTQENHN